MLMRMEQHLRTEEAARKSVEHRLDTALENELRLKKELENLYVHQKGQENEIKRQKMDNQSVRSNFISNGVESVQERHILEETRQQMESEIASARQAAQKAIEDLKTAEERVRSQERAEAAKIATDYQHRITSLGLELERVRQELVIRTKLLSEEMERWRQQAEIAAAAVIEAKVEVNERKRDLDTTREKMDRLMDRLHLGREHGLVLQASLTAANAYTTQAQRSLIHSMEASYLNNVQNQSVLPSKGLQVPSDPVNDPMLLLNRSLEFSVDKGVNKQRFLQPAKTNNKTKNSKSNKKGRS